MSDEEKPRLVAQIAEADLARRRESNRVAWALRNLTANLLRIVRGAGKPYDVMRQIDAFVEAVISYEEAVGLPLHS